MSANYILNKKSGAKNRKRSHGENAGGGKDASDKSFEYLPADKNRSIKNRMREGEKNIQTASKDR